MKKNLAKMLGMEEMQQSTVAEPSYNQQADTKIQEIGQVFDQTQYATDVALESIVSATQLMNVVANNNSTDKVAYSVLKTAVEQLKERTGVYTSSVALEDLSPLNYKSEGIEDIKKFVAKVWEAIKKALSFVKEKVKEFFAWIFKTKTDVVKQAEEAQKKADELEKELHKAPKNENEAKNYKSDYFVKPSALGYTEGTANKTFDKGSHFNTNDKQPEYSGNFGKSTKEYEDAEPVEFSKQVVDALGYGKENDTGSSKDFTRDFGRLMDNLNTLVVDTMLTQLGKYQPPSGDEITEEDLVLDGKFSKKFFSEVGHTDFIIKTNDSRTGYEFEIEQDGAVDRRLTLSYMPHSALMRCLQGSGGCLDLLKSISDSTIPKIQEEIESYEKDMAYAEKRIGNLTDETKINQVKKYQQYCNFQIGVTKSIVTCFGKIVKYLVYLSKALIRAINDKINNIKWSFSKHLKEKGFVTNIIVFEREFLDGNSW